MPREVVMPSPSCPVANHTDLSPGHGPMSGQLVGSRRSKAGPHAYRQHLPQARHIFLGALQHADQHVMVCFFMLGPILARGSDQQLTGAPWLHIERD